MESRGSVIVSSWLCPLCHHFAARTLKGVLRHIGAVHAHEAGFHVICGVQGCPRSYSNYHSYKKHMYQKHRDALEVVGGSSAEEFELIQSNASELAFGPSDDAIVTCTQQDVVQHDEKRQSALFLLKAKTVNKVSNTALNDLIGDISMLLESRIQSVQQELASTLSSRGVQLDSELVSIFQKPSLTAPFEGLHSEYLRKKFFIEKMGLLVSVVFVYAHYLPMQCTCTNDYLGTCGTETWTCSSGNYNDCAQGLQEEECMCL